jgi:Zn-dependent peptidase ImmA (M78 family)/DNA-binding XRE family transcriptional regulator
MASFHQMIGERIALARKQSGMRQEHVAERVGFKDRQTLSYIESGKRRVSSEELVKFMDVLAKPLEFFTDPALVVETDVMSWRTAGETEPEVGAFETWALSLVGAHRVLLQQLNEPISPLRFFLPLQRSSTFEEAATAAENLLRMWSIHSAPAPQLQPMIEKELKVLVLPVDAPDSISGGAVNLAEATAIFINRNHSRGRRHFTLAHELFHVLTWTTMPPARFDWEATTGKPSRVEKLADNFAAALLMPCEVLMQQLREWNETTVTRNIRAADVPPRSWFKKVAEFFEVSVDALKFRLINAKLILADALLSVHFNIPEPVVPAPAFGPTLLERVNRGIDRGLISARKAAALFQTSIDDLAGLLRSNGLEPSFSL